MALNLCWIKFGGYSTSALAGRLLDSEASILVIGGRTVVTGLRRNDARVCLVANNLLMCLWNDFVTVACFDFVFVPR